MGLVFHRLKFKFESLRWDSKTYYLNSDFCSYYSGYSVVQYNNIWKDDVNVLSRDGFFFTNNRQIFNDIPAWKSRLYSTAEVVELLIDHAEEMFVLKRQ